MEFPLYFWAIFIAFIFFVIALDLGIFHKRAHVMSFRESSTMVSVWVLMASLFCTFIYFYSGRKYALEFITGYVVELSLSMDNVFVFLLVFMYFKIPTIYQHRILFWGIVGAIFMRLIMIAGGIYLFQNFEWIFYIFGALLIASAVKICFINLDDQAVNENTNGVIKLLKRFGNVTDKIEGQNFVVYENGKRMFTPLFVALILVEKTDLIFALDSIPAILAITQEPFIVFTSNIFAILGLRSMYFMLEKLVSRFIYLKYGISLILGFIGLKMMLLMWGVHIAVELSLLFIITVLFISISASWYLTRNRKSQ